MHALRVFTAVAAALITTSAARGADAPPGASSCGGCHAAATQISAMAPLAGRPQAELVEALLDFKAGRQPATIMDRIAKGFSEAEIQAIAAWYAAQK